MCCILYLGGELKAGDTLIVDNASQHWGEQSWAVIHYMLNAADVKLLYLPAYSPERNPCELIFNIVKHFLRYHRNGSVDFPSEFKRAVLSISYETMIKEYVHCHSIANPLDAI